MEKLEMFKVWNENKELIGKASGEMALRLQGMAIVDEVYEGEGDDEVFVGWIVEE